MAVLGNGLEDGTLASLTDAQPRDNFDRGGLPVIPRVLIIAGSDSGGGAGIQADLKTVSALGVFGMTAIAALTAQNTTGVYAVVEIEPEFVVRQIEACVSDIGCDAVKVGMLENAAIIEAAQKSRTELIVMGSHGRSGFKRLLLGRVAERVIGRAACPVLVVHKTAGPG